MLRGSKLFAVLLIAVPVMTVPVIAVPVIAAPSLAAAQPTDAETTREVRLGADEEEARAHFQLAQLQFRRGRFAEAAQAFERAYALAPRPELLYNVYLSYRDAGQPEPAAEALRQLLARTDIPAALGRERLEARLATLERELEERRALEARLAAREEELATRASPPPLDPSPPVSTPSTWTPGWAILGTGAALLAVGAATGVGALVLYEDVRARCNGAVCPSDTESDRAAGEALTITTDVLLGVGLATAATGLVLALVVRDPDAPAAAAFCGPDGCVASVGGRF